MCNFRFLIQGFAQLWFFQRIVWGLLLHDILWMNFPEKSFSGYILLTHQISLSDYLYFLRYGGMYILQLFVFQCVMSWILNQRFPAWPKNSEQKSKYLKNEENFSSEMKNMFIISKEVLIVINFLGPVHL